jgi:restriction system protein
LIWVCRAGINSAYLDDFLHDKKVYIPWDGFKVDLKQFTDREQMKALVRSEKGDVAKTSISNWSGQLYTFCWEMKEGDYVLVPHKRSRNFSFGKLVSDYSFSAYNKNKLWHSRDIEIVMDDIPREAFSQSMRYSLGAYRTIFKVKDEDELLASIARYYKQKKV